ncbi:unnamed protein product [Rhizophagus irregularis]|nr:unnamed protein product [Rhizophagus irregularis]
MSTQHNVENLSQWTSSNFEELEIILHDLIPHIRWFQIPSKLFWRKINQFEAIFPKQLYKDIIGYYCDPDTPPTNAILPLRHNLSNIDFIIDSVLIERDHISIIASWIDKKEKSFYNTRNTPYLFKLLYRASRDGFEAAKFHELCDNKAFGSGWDLIINRNNIIKTCGSGTYLDVYNIINSGHNHILEDYEVYQVVKK